MKILKVVGIIMVSLIALFFIVSALLPKDYNVKRSIVINAPASTVYEELRYFKNFNNWSPWYKMDSAMKIEITGPDGEVGAKYSWSSTNKNVGSGSMTRISQETNKSLVSELAIAGFDGTSKAGYTLEEVEGRTKVTWYDDGDLPFVFRFAGLMMDKMMGDIFDKGLQNMKTYIESMPAEAALPEIKVEEQTVAAAPAYTIKATCKESEIGPVLGKLYEVIDKYIKENKLEVVGHPFAIYHKFDNLEAIELEAGVALNKAGKSQGTINAVTLYAGNTVVAHYYGPYENLRFAHEAIDKYVAEHGKKVTGAPWEVYTDPLNIKPNEVLTEVYYPVE